MAFRLASRLCIPVSVIGKQSARSFSGSTKIHKARNGLAGLVGVAAAGIYLGQKTHMDKGFFGMPTVAAAVPKSVNVEQSIAQPTALKQKSPCLNAKPMANSGGCGRRKESAKQEQPNIISPLKNHSVVLWITLKNNANPCATVKAAASLRCLLEDLNDPQCPEEDICAGVGFGPNFYSQVMGKTAKNFYYTCRKGKNGELPSSCGDILVHAKCDNKGKLFEMCQCFLRSLPSDCIEEFEDVYCFNYQDGRDFSGFLINMANRMDKSGLKEVAVEKETGGSYAFVSKWVHDFCAIEDAGTKKLEDYVGRSMECGDDNPNKCPSSHVARMNGGTEYQEPPPYECVRQAQPYGHLAGDAGVYYLAFASDPCSFEFFLDRMIGASCDGGHDDIMKISCNVKGAYWYFPGVEELQQLVDSN